MYSARRRAYEILENDDQRDWRTRAVHWTIVVLVIGTVAAAVLGTIPAVHDRVHHVFKIFDYISFGVFLTEYLARVWSAPEDPRRSKLTPTRARLRYIFSATGIVDMLAIGPLIIAHIFSVDIQVITLLRLVRFLKLLRYSTGIISLADALWTERHTLIACLVVLAAAVVFSSTAMYELEAAAQPEKFGSIPAAMWWSIATLTTVGYGDSVPVTPGGRIVASVTMVTGLIILALPIAVVSNAFGEIIRRRGFVVNWGTLSRLPLFSGLDAGVMGEALQVLAARSYDPGNTLFRPGDPLNELHIIASGDVSVEGPDGRATLSDGDLFGGPAQYGGPRSACLMRALSRTRVLVFSESDLQALLVHRPTFAARLHMLATRQAES